MTVAVIEKNAPLPPLVKGLPLIGSGLGLMNDPLRFLVRAYREYGAVFRVNAGARQMIVLAGLEANQFLGRWGAEYLGSEVLFGGFARELGTEDFLVALDGERHRELRRMMRAGYSRAALLPHFEQVIEVTRAMLRAQPVGARLRVLPLLQRIVTEQLGAVLVHRAPGEYFEDIRVFLRFVMNALVMKVWHPATLKLPAYRKAKARVFELARLVMEENRALPAEALPAGSLIADLLAFRDERGEPLSESALLAAIIGPYFAGMDTVASTLGFMLYALLKHPLVLARVQADVDALFADGRVPDLQALKQAEALYAATMETLRMYPVAAFTPRTATKAFEFGGYTIPQGAEVLVANGVTHYLPEFFAEPQRFDLDRYIAPRAEHRQAGVFAPFSLGEHTCLGANMAETQLMLTMAAILRTVRLQLSPPSFQVQVQMTPIPSPGNRFQVRILEQRAW